MTNTLQRWASENPPANRPDPLAVLTTQEQARTNDQPFLAAIEAGEQLTSSED